MEFEWSDISRRGVIYATFEHEGKRLTIKAPRLVTNKWKGKQNSEEWWKSANQWAEGESQRRIQFLEELNATDFRRYHLQFDRDMLNRSIKNYNRKHPDKKLDPMNKEENSGTKDI